MEGEGGMKERRRREGGPIVKLLGFLTSLSELVNISH